MLGELPADAVDAVPVYAGGRSKWGVNELSADAGGRKSVRRSLRKAMSHATGAGGAAAPGKDDAYDDEIEDSCSYSDAFVRLRRRRRRTKATK